MRPEDRRRLGAIAALVLGVFFGLALVPEVPTGPVGRILGELLWRVLGCGAVGLPLLGFGLALAGFDRVPRLDMKRMGFLLGGLALLVPFTIGVIADVPAAAFDPPLFEWGLAARFTGLLPGFAARGVTEGIGQPGGLLLGFLALSALTLATLAWHPLHRLEKKADERKDGTTEAARRPGSVPPADPDAEAEASGPAAWTRRSPKAKAEIPRERREKRGVGKPAAPDVFPPLDLLNPPRPHDVAADTAQLDRLGQALLDTLRTFKVDGTIAGRTSGPVVTQFEIVPAPGVKAGRIIALADDLAITMRAMSIRVAPIPGRGAVGVEVPNPTARMVTLRELLETDEWGRAHAVMPMALGRDLEGKPVVTDLARMPHLLIAGATGSGKSVAINTIITGLIYRYTPDDLRLLMIDPKMVELSMYNALPHLRHAVVTDNRDAARVLKWAVHEMNRRYELLHANGARNLTDFNRKVEDGKPLRHPSRSAPTLAVISAEAETTPPPPPAADVYADGRLPHLVIIVDELADLMMTVAAEVETPLAMLAQKARAIGIHLILATQRPSVNVITGLIKANFPSRIAFRVASKVDSRTILDGNGAEALLGNGDMLFLPPGKSEPQRIQGAFIGTEETERLMAWFKSRQESAAVAARAEEDILAVMRAQESEEEGDEDEVEAGERDILFREAAETCIQHQGGSTSLLQRKLRIGYGRAARIIDQLHAAGILGPPDGSKPREVLIGLSQLNEYCT
ncbi:MAG TPA: DNA translocase FtsK [Gemmatimonadales bacterium]|jgi:S-DNA-T family DNA segregation ATPase FtsK/SpoIIIE|nr:DNA translocase FtsK [Gemmatimonadales bacterium]